ncbi:MAG TPA: hypothetical protein VFI42_03760, partial [Thermomicrobiaceae bacterium]|nr:hypothetical protein [Thermomicrobiaceae bacterium]
MSATSPARENPAARELWLLLGRLRGRLGRERALVFGLRGLAAALLLALADEAAGWLLGLTLSPALTAALIALPLALALAAMVLRWPSRLEAARLADERLGLAERLATAVELLEAPETGLTGLQLHDALRLGAPAAERWPGALGLARRELLAVALLGMLALGGLLLPGLRGGHTPAQAAQ